MNLLDIANKLELEVIAGMNGCSTEPSGVYIGDLLSLVMAKASSRNIWITIQTHLNVIAVASLVDASAIIVVEDMDINSETIAKAEEQNIPLLKTKLSAYKLACKLRELGL